MELLNKILGHDCKESMAVTLFLKGISEVCTRCPWSALGILNSHVSAYATYAYAIQGHSCTHSSFSLNLT